MLPIRKKNSRIEKIFESSRNDETGCGDIQGTNNETGQTEKSLWFSHFEMIDTHARNNPMLVHITSDPFTVLQPENPVITTPDRSFSENFWKLQKKIIG